MVRILSWLPTPSHYVRGRQPCANVSFGNAGLVQSDRSTAPTPTSDSLRLASQLESPCGRLSTASGKGIDNEGIILAAALLAVAQNARSAVLDLRRRTVYQRHNHRTSAINSPLTGAIMLASPLPPNAVNLAVTTAASWDFSSEYPDLNSATVGGAPWDCRHSHSRPMPMEQIRAGTRR